MRWYNRSWWIVTTLVVLWPIGLLLMWRYAAWSRRRKRIVTGALVWPLGAWWLTRDVSRGLALKATAWAAAGLWVLFAAAFVSALVDPPSRPAEQNVAAVATERAPDEATATASTPTLATTAPAAVSTATAAATSTPASWPPPPSAPTATPPPASNSAADALRQYLREGFGMPGYETSWYANIKDVRVDGRTVIVSTDLFPDAEGKRFATPICGTVSGFVYANGNAHYGLSAVDVRGQSNQRLIYRENLGARCE